ncbi:MAG: ABC transporter substrate-binding protein [Candidatus Thorarchaeota archaeon]|jgi:NitT/TauT family transport system substrate-binding protein
MFKWFMCFVLVCTIGLVGCGGEEDTATTDTGSPVSTTGDQLGITDADPEMPKKSVAWSEYPSWSALGVAHEEGLIHKAAGKVGPLERKWGVDLELKEADYDTCLTLLGSGTVDAACITNMDALAPSLGRSLTVVCPTSTSDGADACITVGITKLEELKGKTTYGLEKSVSQYTFERNLELAGQDPKDYPFKNMDPAAAATAMQTGQKSVESIIVWNPFVLQTLRTRDGSTRLFDSTTIPEEIIDCIVFGTDSLKEEGGEAAASCIVDAFYEVSKLLDDPKRGDATTVALGKKFSNLPLKDMKQVLVETKFYKTPESASSLFSSKKFREETTPKVTEFCVSHGIVDKSPTVGFEDESAQVNFTTKFLDAVKSKK